MNDKISQEEIDRLLNGSSIETAVKDPPLSTDDMDIVGELGNIFMGSAATALSQLLSNRVEITTPTVDIFDNINNSYVIEDEHLIVEIIFTEGLHGTVVLALKKRDSAIIADLMMGGSGRVDNPQIGELQISAVGEAMNQMIGSATTTLSTMLNTSINISPPVIKLLEKDKTMILGEELNECPIVLIKFKLVIGDLIDSELIQFMTIEAAKLQIEQVNKAMKTMSDSIKADYPSPAPVQSMPAAPPSQPSYSSPPPPPPPSHLQYQSQPQPQVTVKPVQFTAFDKMHNAAADAHGNLNLVMDVKLELTVELGRTELSIKNVLELTKGSIIELDKVAGEPVELYANGKLIAKGEVVVIEDNFGLRITNIISPENRMQEL